MAKQRKNTKKTKQNKKSGQVRFFDYNLLFIIIFMVCFGLLMLYSTSSYIAQVKLGDSFYYVKHQGIITIAGIFIMFIVSRIDYHVWARFAPVIYLGGFLLCTLVFVPGIGVERNGSKRWIGYDGLTIQPSEVAKIAIIIFLAWMISRMPKKLANWKTIIMLFAWCAPAILVVAATNLSTAIIIAGIAFMMLFIASRNWKPFVIMMIAGVGVIGMYILLFPYRRERLLIWRHPEDFDAGYQTVQGLYAIGSGGLFGKGLGSSIQKLSALPEPMNDMVFTIICEELGLMGAICVILLFLLMLWRFMVIANNASDLFGSMIVIGVMSHIALQVILNIAVVTNSIPNTGVTLPFISYGGTSILFLLVEMGLALSVSRGIKIEADVS